MYENNQLQFILTSEGRIMMQNNGTYEYQYFLKDHLGNTRITFDENLNILQEDAYYPYGMNIAGLSYSDASPENRYKYNSKELQDDFGLDWYDYGARFYDPQIARWHSVDPKAEEMNTWSPYNYSFNNPIKFIDPTGMNPHGFDDCDLWEPWMIDPEGLWHGYEIIFDEIEGDGDKKKNKTDKTDKTNENKATNGGGDEDNRGQVISVANGAAAAGFGAMGDIGAVVDSYGNSKMYLTLGAVIGWGASAGMGYSQTNKKMSMNDFSGWASGVNLSIGPTPLSFEGYKDMSHGAVRDHYGNNLNGYGGNIGVGAGWFLYFSYTITFSPPSRDFWSRPGSRR